MSDICSIPDKDAHKTTCPFSQSLLQPRQGLTCSYFSLNTYLRLRHKISDQNHSPNSLHILQALTHKTSITWLQPSSHHSSTVTYLSWVSPFQRPSDREQKHNTQTKSRKQTKIRKWNPCLFGWNNVSIINNTINDQKTLNHESNYLKELQIMTGFYNWTQ